MRTILIATTNKGKLRELRALLEKTPVKLLGLGDLDPMGAPEENAPSFEGNADAKAIYYSLATGHWAVADDSGLEVDALNGAPGVHSARYAGADGDDAANNAKLINALRGVQRAERPARFRCAMALAISGVVRARATGVVEGQIIDQPRGSNGFGYDPHFEVDGLNLTSAELTPDHKNRISHRGRALAALIPQITKLLEASVL